MRPVPRRRDFADPFVGHAVGKILLGRVARLVAWTCLPAHRFHLIYLPDVQVAHDKNGAAIVDTNPSGPVISAYGLVAVESSYRFRFPRVQPEAPNLFVV
jgi:hypothetical protein